MVYSRDITDFYVETTTKWVKTESLTDHGEEASQSTYPWKKKLVIHLKRLSDFDINLCCKTPCDTGVNDTLQVETGHHTTTLLVKQETDVQMPTVVQVKGYGLHTGSKRKRSHMENDPDTMAIPNSSTADTESTSQLIARANKLINKVSAALDIMNPDVPQQPATGRSSAPVPPPNVETAAQSKWTVRCKLYTFSCNSVKGLNKHHKEDHGIVTCMICGKSFETKTSLDKHMYCHTKDKAFCCEECGQSFPFKSRLIQHQITHTREPLFMCKHDQCTKGFKNKGDLNRHMRSHSNIWYNCRTCTYRNKDKDKTLMKELIKKRAKVLNGIVVNVVVNQWGSVLRDGGTGNLGVTPKIYMCKQQANVICYFSFNVTCYITLFLGILFDVW